MAGADGAPNVIPQSAELHGTARSFTTTAQETTERRLREICAGVAATYGATIEVSYVKESPAVVNESACTALVAAAAKSVCPTEGCISSAQGEWVNKCSN
jgi:hippurate hydrolase